MVRALGSLVLAAVVGVALFAVEGGCGESDYPSNGPNAPCTRSKDCSAGLTGIVGVCTDPDASAFSPDASDGSFDSEAKR